MQNNNSTSPIRDTPTRPLYSNHSPRTLGKSVEDPDKRLLFKNFVSKCVLWITIIISDFDENRFDLDEYEQRLKRFEDYLLKKEDE